MGKYASVVGSNVMRARMLSGMPRGYGYAAKSSTTLTVTFELKKGSQYGESSSGESRALASLDALGSTFFFSVSAFFSDASSLFRALVSFAG